MHTLEPYFNWRHLYRAEDDEYSPFFGKEYSEFEFTHSFYDHALHPQWDSFGSSTLFMKLLFVDYDEGFCIIEFIGEWNDCIHNDIMTFKRDIAEMLMGNGISRFMLIVENVLNFHTSDDLYYEEWWEEVEDMNGWICMVNVREHVSRELMAGNIDNYLIMGGDLDQVAWRSLQPANLLTLIEQKVTRRLGV